MFLDYIIKYHFQDLLKILSAEDNLGYYRLKIDFLKLFETYPDVGDKVLCGPVENLPACNKDIIKAQQNLLEFHEYKAEILKLDHCSLKRNVQARFYGLPVCPELHRTVFPKNVDLGCFLKVTGTVVRVTQAKMLEYQRKYICAKCKFENCIEAEFENRYILKAPSKCRNDNPKCKCTTFTQVNLVSREHCRDYQEIKLQEQVNKLSIGTIPGSMWVVLENDLVDCCKPGDDVVICGTVRRRWRPCIQTKKSEVELVLQANYTEVCNSQRSEVVSSAPDINKFCVLWVDSLLVQDHIKDCFDEYWTKYEACPLKGRGKILMGVCPQVYGLQLVKLAVLLTVITGSNHIADETDKNTSQDDKHATRVRGQCHLLLVGDPGTGKSQLLKAGVDLTARSVFTSGAGSTRAGLTCAALREEGEWQLEAGALVLSDGGVCCIDEISQLRAHDRAAIHEAMEQQTISVAKEQVNKLSIGTIPGSMWVVLENDLVDCCKPGDDVVICGTVRRRWRPCIQTKKSEVELVLQANYTEVCNSQRSEVVSSAPDIKDCFDEYWTKYEACPLKGRGKILMGVCPQVYGLQLVKLAVLLTVITGSNHIADETDKNTSQDDKHATRVRGQCHLLLVGDPGTGKSQLLKAGVDLTARSVFTSGAGSTRAGLTCAALREEGEWQLEAGALVLSDGGVCCIDEISQLRAHDRAAIHEAMEQQTISVAKEQVNKLSIGTIPGSMWVVLENDLVDCCKPGDDVVICGTVRRRWRPCIQTKKSEVELVLQANYTEVCNSQRSEVVSSAPDIKDCFDEYWTKYEACPLKGRGKILMGVCPQVYGLQLVKLAVLLTVITGSNHIADETDKNTSQDDKHATRVRGQCHLLLVGDPGTGKSQLLKAGVDLTARSVFTSGAGSTRAGLTCAALREEGEWQLEAGALVLSDGGVCCIDEISQLRAHDRAAIHEAMEQQTISVAKEQVNKLSIGTIPGSMWVVLENDLVDCCKPGDDVVICGTVRRRWRPCIQTKKSEVELVLQANYTEVCNSQRSEVVSSAPDIKDCFDEYWTKYEACPLKGRGKILMGVCPQVYGLQLVKLAVLLTVITGSNHIADETDKNTSQDDKHATRVRGQCHLLLVGDPGTGKSQLLKAGVDLTARSVFTSGAGSTRAGLTCAALREEGEWQLEAGALVLSDGGVCCIDEISQLRAHDRAAIHEAMEQQTISVAKEQVNKLSIGTIPGSMWVVLENDLVDCCKPGDDVVICGTVRRRWRPCIQTKKSEVELVLQANYTEVCNSQRSEVVSSAPDIKDCFDEYWTKYEACPLKGRGKILMGVCPQVYGLQLVKLAVLLTVITGSNHIADETDKNTSQDDKHATRVRGQCHLLLVGDPGTGKSQLLKAGVDLTARSVFTSGAGSTRAGLTCAALREEGEWQLEAGALVLSDGGVCCIDEISQLRAHDRAAIHEAMEQQTISVAKEQVNKLSIGTIPGSMWVVLENDLVDCCKPGDDVVICGTVRRRWRPCIQTKKSEVELVLQANYTEVCNSQRSEVVSSAPDIKDCFDEYWTKYEACPLKGRGKILMGVCPQVYGLQLVKLAVLLTVITGSNHIADETDKNTSQDDKHATRVRGQCHLLLDGDPGTGKSQLLKAGVDLTARSVFTSGAGSTRAGLTCAALREEGEWQLEAGALVLSDGGVCCIDEISQLRAHDRAAIHEAMEQQTISVAKEQVNKLSIGTIPGSMWVVLENDLVDCCKPGDDVVICGTVRRRWRPCIQTKKSEVELVLQANYTEVCNSQRSEVVSSAPDIKDCFDEYWTKYEACPLKGRGKILMGVCPQVYGLQLVKLAVLLTVITGSNHIADETDKNTSQDDKHATRVRGQCHLLLVGDPGTGKSQLLKAGVDLTARSVFTSGAGSTRAGLTCAALREEGEWQLEAGALVLSDGGVCCIDEISQLRAHDRAAIHEAMEQQTISVAKEQVNKLSIGTIPGSMWVVLENDLVDCCKPGDDVVICGTVRRRWRPCIQTKKSEVELVLQANYTEVCNSQRSEVVSSAPDIKDCFDEYWTKYEACPLKGRGKILMGVCPQVYGLQLVKLAVLLTVITGSNHIADETDKNTSQDDKHATRVRGQCHLLLVGDPGTGKSQLLKAGVDLTARSVFTSGAGSTRAGLTCAALREEGEWQLEAGALVLSDGGVCCIDEISQLRAHDRAAIHEAMEQQTISVAKEQVNKLSIGTIPGSMWVVLENDLVDCCKPGDDVVICGTVRRRWRPCIQTKKSEVELVLQANYTEVCNSQRSEVVSSAPDIKDCFDEYWTKYEACPLKGRGKILMGVCPQVYGLQLVKLAVLLTVITGSNHIADETDKNTSQDDKHATRVRGQCHLLLVGDPGTGKSQLLKAGVDLTARSVFTSGAGSTRAGLTCAALREEGEWQLEAGALVLSDGGVCCIDEISQLRAHDRAAIHEAMEQQTISVAKEQVNKLSIGTIPGSMWVVLENDLVDCCKPGDDVVICGTVRRRWRPCIQTKKSEVELVLQANYTEVCNSQRSEVVSSAPDIKDCFDEYWTKYEACPLKGRGKILMGVCPQVYGLQLVKLAVLLTVITGSNHIADETDKNTSQDDKHATRVRGQCHLLLVGDPGTGKSQLLKAGVDLTARSVFTSGAGSTRAGLTCAALREEGEWQLEAGALVLSDGGVCCIDEISQLRAHDRAAIHEAMEQQTISVAKAGIVCKLNTRCAIIAACNPKGHYEADQPLSVNVSLGTPLLSRFDLIFILLDSKNKTWDKLVSLYILSEGGTSNSTRLWNTEKIQMYISLIGPRCTEMTKTANIILQSYYMMQRKAEHRDPSRTTVRMLDSLVRLSQAHCRLMYRTTILPMDAIIAISLVDLSMQDCTLNDTVDALHSTFQKYPDFEYLCLAKNLLSKLHLYEIWQNELLYYGKLIQVDHKTLEAHIDKGDPKLFAKYDDVTEDSIQLTASLVTSSYFNKTKQDKEVVLDGKENKNDGNGEVQNKLAATLKKHATLNKEVKKPPIVIKKAIKRKRKEVTVDISAVDKKVSKKSKKKAKVNRETESENEEQAEILKGVPSVNDIFADLGIDFNFSSNNSDIINSTPNDTNMSNTNHERENLSENKLCKVRINKDNKEKSSARVTNTGKSSTVSKLKKFSYKKSKESCIETELDKSEFNDSIASDKSDTSVLEKSSFNNKLYKSNTSSSSTMSKLKQFSLNKSHDFDKYEEKQFKDKSPVKAVQKLNSIIVPVRHDLI